MSDVKIRLPLRSEFQSKEESITKGMRVDILSSDSVFSIPGVSDIKCLSQYGKYQDDHFTVDEVIKFVVLLYSKDSIVNKKPMPPLHDRRAKAAILAGLKPDDINVQELLFNLISDQVRDLVLDYMIWFSDDLWMERSIVESQLDENRRMRLKPIQNKTTVLPKKKGRKKEDDEFEDEDDQSQDDAYILSASKKKFELTDHADRYQSLIKKYDLEIFMEHEDLRNAAVRRKRVSLEAMVK